MAWNDPPSFDYQQVSNSAKFKHRYVKVGQSQQFQSQQFQPQQFQPHQQQSMPMMQESCNNVTATYVNEPRDNFAPYNGQQLNQDIQYKGMPVEQAPCPTATSALPSDGAGNFAGQMAGQGSTNLFQGGR